MMMGDGSSWWGMVWLWGGLHMLLFWVGVLLLAVLLVRWLLPTTPQRQEAEVFDILRRRYAAGEISQAEYEQARRILEPVTTGKPDV